MLFVYLSKLKRLFFYGVSFLLLLISRNSFADSGSPFPTITTSDGDIVKAVGGHMEVGMKYALIGGGIIMLLVGVGVIAHRLREDTTNREGGNFLVTLVMAGIAITAGVILLSIGWTAASYNVS